MNIKVPPERKLGETFLYNNSILEVEKDTFRDCSECYFWSANTCNRTTEDLSISGLCAGFIRSDRTDVIFRFIKNQCPSDVTPEQAKAIDIAEAAGLGIDVEHCIFDLGMSPEEALRDWDLLQVLKRTFYT